MRIYLVFLVFSGIIFGSKSNASKKAQESEKPQNIYIENLTSTMDWRSRELSISWNIKSLFKNTISYYIIKIKNGTSNCLNAIFYFSKPSIAESQTNRSDNECSKFLNYSISFNSTFNTTIKFNDTISNFFVEIHGSHHNSTRMLNNQSIKHYLEKPTNTIRLEFKERNESYFILKWKADEIKNINNTIMGYRIKYLNISKEFNYNITEATITNLIQCHQYCFNISTFNDAGSSPDIKTFCNSTLPPNLAKVNLENISSGYATTRRINWTYSGSDKCINYQLEYWDNDSVNKTIITVNNSKSYQLSNLIINKVYSVKVKPITKVDTNNKHEAGKYSNIVQFYHGIETISISNLNYSMNWIKKELSLSWNINKTFADSLSNYTIDISDQSKNCSKIYIYRNNINQSIINKSESLDNCESQLKVNVTINTNSNNITICCNKAINLSIEIYGTNVMKRQTLNNGTISIKMLKPDTIKNITVNRKDLQSLNLTWAKSDTVDKNKPVMGYRIENLKSKNITNVTNSYFTISNLNQCTKYCFNISAYNDAGISSSMNYCVSTNATNLSEVKLLKISSEYNKSRQIEWEYRQNNSCSVYYTVEYWIKNSQNKTTVEKINEKKLEINDLKLNEIYEVQVIPVTDFDTADGKKIGNSSNTVEFFTGAENISISNLTYSMNWTIRELFISWNINKTFADSLFNYTIEILDHSNNWTKTIIYENTIKKDIIDKSEPLKSCENQSKVNHKINATYFSSKSIFCNKTINFSIEIYGTNVMKRHTLNYGTISIKMSEPDPIKNITVNRKDLHSLNLSLVKSDPEDKNKPVMGYRIENLEWKNITNVNNSYFTISNLNMCKKYCFNISAYNDAGISSSMNYCVSTNATNLSKVNLLKISSEHNKSRQIEWEYHKNNSCSVYYTVEYWIKNSQNKTKVEKINDTKLEINDLKLNEIYEVRVIPVTDFDTADGKKIGNSSNTVEFFTGAENIFISNLTYSMNWTMRDLSISWKINKTFAESLFNYTIKIVDHSNNWTKTIIYENTDQKDIIDKSEPLKSCENQSKVNDKINATYFSSKIRLCNKTIRIYIEIFGTNRKGCHILNSTNIEMLKPDPIKNITVNRKDLHSLNLMWAKSDTVNENKPVMGYRIEYLKEKNITNVTNSYFTISNLNQCIKYCFNISAYNDAGISSSMNYCVSTNATNLSEVKLLKISSEYNKSRQIEWEYHKNNSCSVYYTVEYWIKNSQNKTTVEKINDTKLEINDLKLNEIYEVRVIPVTDFDTADGKKIGNSSNTVEFFTGAANSGAAVVVSILFILIIGCLIYLAIRNREKLNNYFPFISYLPFKGDNSRQNNSENANQKAIQMNEQKSEPVLDERFFDCNTLSEFLNKIVEYQRSLTDFPNYVLFMKENKDIRLIQEYAKLNNLAATLEHQLKLTKFIGKSPFNLKKNRFRNILPFDQNLVYLKSKSAPDNYLNASYIPFSNDDGSVEYIASQGPIESTISDFILMIWEQKITCIVMLTRTYEDDKFKCLQYWPDDLREICRFGNQKEFLVAKLYEKEETSYFERKFSLKNSITHEERIIYHIHMHMWMDFSAPDLKDFCSVLSRFQDMRETIVNSPFLVHCSAGVGRTGTFICIDRIVRLVNKGQQYIDVFKSVMELRSSRNLLVQRQSQYIFIHEFLNFYIQKYLTDNIQVVSTV